MIFGDTAADAAQGRTRPSRPRQSEAGPIIRIVAARTRGICEALSGPALTRKERSATLDLPAAGPSGHAPE